MKKITYLAILFVFGLEATSSSSNFSSQQLSSNLTAIKTKIHHTLRNGQEKFKALQPKCKEHRALLNQNDSCDKCLAIKKIRAQKLTRAVKCIMPIGVLLLGISYCYHKKPKKLNSQATAENSNPHEIHSTLLSLIQPNHSTRPSLSTVTTIITEVLKGNPLNHKITKIMKNGKNIKNIISTIQSVIKLEKQVHSYLMPAIQGSKSIWNYTIKMMKATWIYAKDGTDASLNYLNTSLEHWF